MVERVSSMDHLMELPSIVLMGEGILDNSDLISKTFKMGRRGLVVTGPHVWPLFGEKLSNGLGGVDLEIEMVEEPTVEVVETLTANYIGKGINFIVGLGGGKNMDVAKVVSYRLSVPYISVPTNSSQDGIASPMASLRGADKPYSLKVRPPVAVLADTDVIRSAPKDQIISGVGELMAKVTAVRDWRLARRDMGEYYGDYAARLALTSANHAMHNAAKINQLNEEGIRGLVEALISAGVAAGIAGSSRPCSGSEHLISHALGEIAPQKGVHGEKVGLAAVLISYFYGMNWRLLIEKLKVAGLPIKFLDMGITKDELIAAVVRAPDLRPDRYTILHKLRPDRSRIAASIEAVDI
ncbi:MAG: iron-containing alcohol dehydrogenase [Nitrososphaerota archaeon]|nr:iron-containing alcohol dehydrogenase [Nitrososphaerota archaeon]MDG7038010.1 iron-containing alcohol dehydrogenase [Nitrososphaerota archaeon]MDG7040037.1 iron-containing alcohol dehydrogenase [Nitrososphaerota archaeon]MDG7041808.1 iron-containing alcohol dehydrogenase [Nitrososphaerota archaeon]MDG7045317.1 iron-containing alcohol dehydrogenase [Nitrososphaerota archaeon]